MRVLRCYKFPVVLCMLLVVSMAIVVCAPQSGQACGYTTWYLPEGYTGGNFDTYILIQNPSSNEAEASLKFLTDSKVTEPLKKTLPPNSRTTVKVDDVPGLSNAYVSTIVEATGGIIVERSMYFDYEGGRAGGHDSIGASSTSRIWYLAEGYTGGSFDTYVLVMNPSETQTAHIKVKFIKNDKTGTSGREMNPYDPEPEETPYIEKYYDIPPMRRFTIFVDAIPGLENTEVSTIVYSVAAEGTGGTGDEAPGVVAERSMYFDYGGIDGGSCSIGSPSTSSTWFMPEGRTTSPYDTYVLVMNPNSVPVNVKATFMIPGKSVAVEEDPATDPEEEGDEDLGTTVVKDYQLDPYQRFTIDVDKIPGLESTDVSTMIESSAVTEESGESGAGNYYVVAERAMYFSNGLDGDGHNSMGATEKKGYWMMAEGYTGGRFDTWILIQNPNDVEVKVKATYMKNDGSDPIVEKYTINPKSRYTVKVDDIEGLSDAEVSTKLELIQEATSAATYENGIIAERAMYFVYNGIAGGSCSLGLGE